MSRMKDTVLRFERPLSKKITLAALDQKKKDEYRAWMAERDAINEVNIARMKSAYCVQSDERAEHRVIYHRTERCDMEIGNYAKTAIVVRRRAMEVQKQGEMEQYGGELVLQSKAFHKERI